MSPETKEKRSAALREAASSPEHRVMISDIRKRTWAQPGFREERSAATRKAWLSPETKKKAAASQRETWMTRSEDKAIWAARLSAQWKIPENRDLFLRTKLFRRDDDNPKMKMRWDKMKKEAETFANNLNTAERQVQYHNAFVHLHLDASQYDANLSHATTLRKSIRPAKALALSDTQLSKLKEKFFENVLLTGSPTMSSKAFDELAEELQCGNKNSWLRKQLNKERTEWMRAAAVLRRKNISVDYANIPHLAWLE